MEIWYTYISFQIFFQISYSIDLDFVVRNALKIDKINIKKKIYRYYKKTIQNGSIFKTIVNMIDRINYNFNRTK